MHPSRGGRVTTLRQCCRCKARRKRTRGSTSEQDSQAVGSGHAQQLAESRSCLGEEAAAVVQHDVAALLGHAVQTDEADAASSISPSQDPRGGYHLLDTAEGRGHPA